MFSRTRLLGIVALGLGLSVLASAQPSTPPPFRPAVDAIVKLADKLERRDVAAEAKNIVETHDSCSISRVFTSRGSGGAGIGSAAKAGHQDSIHSLVRDWSGDRAPTKQELQTHQKDLLKAARVLQAMAELAPFRLPHVLSRPSAKQKENWQIVSEDFKRITRSLHDAIKQEDPIETRKAAVRLQKTCNACHEIVGI